MRTFPFQTGHNATGSRGGGASLRGDHGPIYPHSYWAIIPRDLVADGKNGPANRPPRAIGSSASRLMKLIDGSRYEAGLPAHERRMIRLWIETGAAYGRTPGRARGRAPASQGALEDPRQGLVGQRYGVVAHAARLAGQRDHLAEVSAPQAELAQPRDVQVAGE